MREAVELVNQNSSMVNGTLRATGSVDGTYLAPGGRTRSYHLDAALFHLRPGYFRFDLKSFGERQILVGSNLEWYWSYTREEDRFFCGRHDRQEELPAGLPAHPDQMIDALGLSLISGDSNDSALIQRIENDHQEILFIEHSASGGVRLQKEYWLDRRLPRLIERVVFRDADGAVEMDSRLSQYACAYPDGPLLPHVISAAWPKLGATMRLRIRRWSLESDVKADGPQFVTPRECINEE